MNKEQVKECCPIIKSDDGAQEFIDWMKSINQDFERFFDDPAEGRVSTQAGGRNANKK